MGCGSESERNGAPAETDDVGATAAQGSRTPTPRALHRVGTVEAFPVGAMTIVRIGAQEIGVLRRRDGRFHAIRNRCPHRGAPICRGVVGGTMLPSAPGVLVFGLEGAVIRCPWHGYEFDIASGESLFNPVRLKLRTYPVEVRENDVFVRI